MGGEQDAHELGAGVDVGGDLVGDGLWLVGRRSDVGRQRHVLQTNLLLSPSIAQAGELGDIVAGQFQRSAYLATRRATGAHPSHPARSGGAAAERPSAHTAFSSR